MRQRKDQTRASASAMRSHNNQDVASAVDFLEGSFAAQAN
jgi:hypothetical protein